MKDILESHLNKQNKSETLVNGVKKRSDLAPGEQRSRGYNLPMDKTNFRFGDTHKNEVESVANCIRQPVFNPEVKTEFELKNVETIRLAKNAPPFQSTSNKFNY